VYPDSRPQINVADAINSVAGAFNQTKQGVLQRAMLQAQNTRANQQSQIEQEHAQAELRAQGFRPPEEMAGMGAGGSQSPAPATPGPIAAAVNGPPVAGGAPVAGVSGMASPGRILPITGSSQATLSAQMAPTTVAPGTPPMQIQSGALPATTPPMSAGEGSVMGGPSSLPTPSMAPAQRPLVTLGGNGPHGNWVRDLSQPLPQEQREIYIRQQALSAANDAYTREHPGAPPLFTPSEIAFGSQSDRVYNTMANRAETYQQQKIEKQQRYNDLEGATDASGAPLTDVQRRSISNDPIAYRNFVGNPAVPPKEAKETPAEREQSEERVHKANRQTDADIPVRGEGGDPDTKAATLLYNHLLTKYMAPSTNSIGLKQPGQPVEKADAQARQEVAALYPDVALPGGKKGGTPVTPEVPTPTAADSSTAKTAMARIGQNGVTLQDALNSPSLTPGVKALIRQHFQSNGH
jgi:hypothetical protein